MQVAGDVYSRIPKRLTENLAMETFADVMRPEKLNIVGAPTIGGHVRYALGDGGAGERVAFTIVDSRFGRILVVENRTAR